MSRELAPVRVAFVEPVTRSGTGVHQGVTLGVGDSVLVAGQIVDPENNGVYLVQSGAWTRRADFNAGSESATPNMLPGSWLRALEGHYQGSYYFANAFIPQAGLSVINWYRENYGATLTGGSGVVIDQANATVALRERVGVQGTYTNPVVTLDAHGVADDAFSGDFDPSHALGLAMEWRSATAVAVGPGSVWIPGTGAGELLVVGAPIVKTRLVLPASSWVFTYIWSNAGTPDLEFSTTAPVVYHGFARHKSGDPTRRYVPLGALRTDASGNIRRFWDTGNLRRWLLSTDTLRLLSGGSATTNTVVSAAPFMPPTSRTGFFRLVGAFVTAPGTAFLSGAGTSDGLSPQAGEGQLAVFVRIDATRHTVTGPVMADAAQQLRYAVSDAGISASVEIMGYSEER